MLIRVMAAGFSVADGTVGEEAAKVLSFMDVTGITVEVVMPKEGSDKLRDALSGIQLASAVDLALLKEQRP